MCPQRKFQSWEIPARPECEKAKPREAQSIAFLRGEENKRYESKDQAGQTMQSQLITAVKFVGGCGGWLPLLYS
jgi:hypothetical protein